MHKAISLHGVPRKIAQIMWTTRKAQLSPRNWCGTTKTKQSNQGIVHP